MALLIRLPGGGHRILYVKQLTAGSKSVLYTMTNSNDGISV